MTARSVWLLRCAGVGTAVAAVSLDQWTKTLARSQLPAAPFELGPLLDLRLSFNTGISFSLFTAETELARWGLVTVTGAIAVWLLGWLWREAAMARVLALGLVAGGAIGNIADRILRGAVTDFIDVHLADAHWPTFNLADSAIFVGVACLVLSSVGRASPHRAGQPAPSIHTNSESPR